MKEDDNVCKILVERDRVLQLQGQETKLKSLVYNPRYKIIRGLNGPEYLVKRGTEERQRSF